MQIICPYQIPEELRQSCSVLENDPRLYVLTDLADEWVPTDLLLLSRARPEGIYNGVRRMREAAAGLRRKRVPIKVTQLDRYYFVHDGNSTAIILSAIGIELMPVKKVS